MSKTTTSVDKRHLYWLDWLRFTAALMVVACHARGGNWVEWGRLDDACQTNFNYVFFAATRAGFEWVIVFFVLSGFLVGGKVLERVGNSTFDVLAYAVDRTSRIWMPLIPALLLTAGIGGYLGHPISVGGFLRRTPKIGPVAKL
jgi:peptidoglycan/LPS O-acetylase OafA/YrhL